MDEKLNKKYLTRMKNLDNEFEHEEADFILCCLLIELGYEELVTEYRRIPKWYS